MNRKKRLLLFAMPAAVLGIGAGGVAFTVMAVKDQTYVPSAPYAPGGEPNREVAVVYYSRSGHSEAVAREIARTFNAPIARIDADYPRDFSGQRKAVSDARARALPPDPRRAHRPRSGAPRFPRVADLDVPPGDAALGLRGAGCANGQGGRARNDRQQPLRAGGDRRVREAGRGARRPPHRPRLPAPRPHLLAEEPRGALEGGPSGDSRDSLA